MNVLGHRGCPEHFPENTIAAVRGSAPHVDMVEIDVRRCGSGEVVVFHDENLDRLTGSSGRVSETPRSALASLRVSGSEEPIPTLDAVVAALPAGTGLNVELKHAGLAKDVVPLLEELDNDVVVSSFERDALAEIAAGEIPTALLFGSAFEASLDTAIELSCEFVHPHYDMLDRERVKLAHDRGLSVNAWTAPTADVVDWLREIGVDGVIVDSWTVV